MEMRKIGSLDVSVVGVGCNNFGWNIDEAATANVVHAALDAGINFFDTADVYGKTQSEQFLGKALVGRRDEAIIATKFGHTVDENRKGARPDYIRQAVEDSLKRLGIETIDLYQIHTPDATVPIADTLGALNELVIAGKVREIGCSNFTAAMLREAKEAVKPGAARFVSVQNEYSLLHRAPEADVLPECERLGLGFLPYFPIASGLLTGKYRKNQPLPEGTRISKNSERFGKMLSDKNLDLVEALIAFSEARGHTILELAFSWLVAKPTVTSVIAGATSPAQIQSNTKAPDWTLSSEELAEIDQILVG